MPLCFNWLVLPTWMKKMDTSDWATISNSELYFGCGPGYLFNTPPTFFFNGHSAKQWQDFESIVPNMELFPFLLSVLLPFRVCCFQWSIVRMRGFSSLPSIPHSPCVHCATSSYFQSIIDKCIEVSFYTYINSNTASSNLG